MGHTYLSLMNVLSQKLFSNFTIIMTARWVKRDAFLMENPYFFIIELYILTEEVSKFSRQKKKI